ncbi:MAG TPA: tetratricopeptide repeat protein, partial [Chromatiales bacterium]|nr:tetratricopeptide repeat protein [Chromatiales bacterium]
MMSSAGRIGGMLLAALCCLPALPVAGESAKAPAESAARVANLFYGDALFHYYQNDPFGTIVRILAYDSQDRLGSDRAEARLLLAGTRLAWGQTAAAEADFRRLLDAHALDRVRNRAWFQLARIAYARDEFPRVLQSLAHINAGWGTSEQQGERRLLKALALLKSGKLEPARETLARHGGASLMQHYLSYNLGVLLARSGRLEEAIQAWDEAAFETPRDAEQAALDDLVNSVAGHALLRAGRDRAAATRLARVRVQGPYSDKALLSYGLALFRQDRLEEAIGVWQTLVARDRVSPAVLEARLAIPHALARLGALGQAAEAYQAAIAHFDQRERQLTALLRKTD